MIAVTRHGNAPLRTGAALVALLLASCATPTARVETPRFSGRIALQIAAKLPGEPAHNVSAHFELSGDATRGRLDLSTPLGTRLAEAYWRAGSAWLVGAGGQETSYADVDALTRAVLGEALPIGALFDWLAGRPWPAAPSEPLAAPAGPGFRQLDWEVDLAHAPAGLFAARRTAPPAVSLRVRLDPAAPQD